GVCERQSVFENTPISSVPKAASRHQKALTLSTGMGTNTASTAAAASNSETMSTGQVGGVNMRVSLGPVGESASSHSRGAGFHGAGTAFGPGPAWKTLVSTFLL